MDELQKANHVPVKYGKYESQKLGTTVDTIRVNGVACKVELDNTILKVYLPQILKSHSSISFEMNFKTYFDFGGTTRRRMKEYISGGFKHYNGVHWYPRICVFDKKFGWTTDQHMGKEFYGDFGTYDVSLQFNSTFILEATGNLTNENEVLPDSLKKFVHHVFSRYSSY
jgi:aminopeptidase N